MALLSKEEVRAQLPKLGDHLMLPPTIDETTPSRGAEHATRPQHCVVVEVNAAHLWYTVRFDSGFRESYKVPKLVQRGGGPNE